MNGGFWNALFPRLKSDWFLDMLFQEYVLLLLIAGSSENEAFLRTKENDIPNAEFILENLREGVKYISINL